VSIAQEFPTSRRAEVEAAAKVGTRIVALDGLRAVAVSVVILSHLFRTTFEGGFLGVDIFFVISGYIITERLLREHNATGTLSLSRFYVRRMKRLWPALLLLIVVATMLSLSTGRAWGKPMPPSAVWRDAVFAITSTMNIASAGAFGGQSFLGHTWSLAAEEQFYLIWPAVLLIALRGRFREHLPVMLLGAIGIVSLWRIVLTLHGAPPLRTYMGPDTRADALLFGCLLALVGTSRLPQRLLRLWIIPSAVLAYIVLHASLASSMVPIFGYSVIALCSAWLVAASAEDDGLFARALSLRPVQWAGLRSYSLYLWHPIVVGLLEETHMRERYAALIALPVIALLAEVSYRVAENALVNIRPPDRPSRRAST
jgi:peptidoglycan/LPS O-acetylase OafA/YrhL